MTTEGEPYKPGDYEDFARLYRDAYPKLLGVAIRLLHDTPAAEDVVHDSIARAWEKWPSFKPDAPAEAWLVQIVKNAAISWIRHEGIRTADEYIRRVGEPAKEGDPAIIAEGDLESFLLVEKWQLVLLKELHGEATSATPRSAIK